MWLVRVVKIKDCLTQIQLQWKALSKSNSRVLPKAVDNAKNTIQKIKDGIIKLPDLE